MYSLRNHHCSLVFYTCSSWRKAAICACIVATAIIVGIVLSIVHPYQRHFD
jgi:hypothetical protein